MFGTTFYNALHEKPAERERIEKHIASIDWDAEIDAIK